MRFASTIENDASFKATLKTAIDEAQAEGTIGALRANALRRRSERPRLLERMREAVADEAVCAGCLVPAVDGVYGAIDWNAILEFIKELLPILLKLFNL